MPNLALVLPTSIASSMGSGRLRKVDVARGNEAPAFGRVEFKFTAWRKANDAAFNRRIALHHPRLRADAVREA